MTMISIEKLKSIVREASKLMTLDHFDIRQKDGDSNIVTSSDIAVQDFLLSRLAEELPGSGFISEEDDINDAHHDYVWIIDPIDGTANYSRGIDQCAISVGLRHGKEMVMGVVYLPRTDEMFEAELGKGSRRNGAAIHVSDRGFSNAILCTALPVYHKEYADVCSKIICEAFKQCNDIRRFGAAAPELCYLAMGRCELYFEYLLSPWDFAASMLIIKEAGGVICRPDGKEIDPTHPSGVVAANSSANLQRLLTIIHQFAGLKRLNV